MCVDTNMVNEVALICNKPRSRNKEPLKLYSDIYNLVKDKEHFIITTKC